MMLFQLLTANTLYFLSLLSVTFGADCFTDQQRKDGGPSGTQIVNALTKLNQIESVCAGNWRVNDDRQLQNGFNHGSLIYDVQRTDKNQPLRYCQDAMNNIIDQCISNGNYWGGIWSLNGEIYRISNSVYPNNPLMSNDEGGPTAPNDPVKGPITTQTGTFTTTTQSIAGLTANSATTTSPDGNPTVLPIWYVGPGLGIIVIPAAGIIPGGVVPPPPGYPPLSINPDGNPETAGKPEGQKEDDSTTTTTSSSKSCASACAACTALGTSIPDSDIPNDNGDPDFPTLDPKIWDGMPTPAFNAPQQPAPEQTQEAVLITEPGCTDSKVDKKAVKGVLGSIPAKDKSIDIDTLLYRLRQQLCAGPCAAPEGIPDNAVAIYQTDAECEISVGLSADAEAYFYRGTAPLGDQWQQCWDATDNIINKCVKNGAKEGWWNGNHVYQFYQGGVRPLNDPGAKHTTTKNIDTWPMPSTDGLTCEKDCHGYVPNPDFCRVNCPQCTRYNVCRRWIDSDAASKPSHKRSNRINARDSVSKSLKKRAAQTILNVGYPCAVAYVMPDYPSAGVAEAFPQVARWYDRDPATCTLQQMQNRVGNNLYHTEHVWEKHFIKSFMYWLISGVQMELEQDPPVYSPIISCAALQFAFNTRSTTPGSLFVAETAAQQLGKAISCRGAECPDDNRVNEFFLLKDSINNLKNKILSGFTKNNNIPETHCKAQYQAAYDQMQNTRAVFAYMRRQEVFNAFNAVHTRVRQILQNLDQDPTFGQIQPALLQGHSAFPATWEGAYQEWMARLLLDAERKMHRYMFNCAAEMVDGANADGNVDQAVKNGYAVWADAFRRDESSSLGGIYDGIRRDGTV